MKPFAFVMAAAALVAGCMSEAEYLKMTKQGCVPSDNVFGRISNGYPAGYAGPVGSIYNQPEKGPCP